MSIYIHIPFCIKKCNYCDFLSAPADCRTQEEYLRALEGEIQKQAKHYRDYAVKTVYIGGGTPSVVPCEQLCHMLQVLASAFQVDKGAEVSMEANPGTLDRESLFHYREAGINRLSMGLQSADDRELARLGRIHSYADFLESYKLAVEAGFHNINVDLMSALPEQRVEDYADTVKKVLALTPRPAHISAYSLIMEEGTPFYEKYGAEWERMAHTGETQAHLPSEEEEREMYRLTEKLLAAAGYHRYEISNYSLTGYECVHNKVYWKRGDYAGFGLGAASMVGNVRFRNTHDLQRYIKEEEKTAERVKLAQKEQMEEFMFLGLRLTEGVERKEFQESFGVSLEAVYGEIIKENVEKGLITDGDRIALTERGADFGNYVSAQFLQ
ncbi:MAG: radical SAM family heme chaperone HemW [Lachnospiraceae bacterium]|nr:radical SAM family heme chaperone HemW [Lachnospiraceae bacterium]